MKRIAIVGLGLIGGSLGLALKRSQGGELEIVGFARRPEVAAEAVKRGAVDQTVSELDQAVSGADIVIVATPVMAIREILENISDHLLSNAIVSDVGSTKAQVVEWAKAYLPPGGRFVGGHPMTGKETSGFDEAQADLFENSVYCLTPTDNTDREALAEMRELVEKMGARPFLIDPVQHDEMVAGISHLPLLLSSALVSTLSEDELWGRMAELAAGGFRDMTRLAAGSPEMYYGICATNRQAIVEWIDRYIEHLQKYRRLVLDDDEELQKSLMNAREVRRNWLQKEGRRFQS